MSTVAIAANIWAESNVCKMEMKDRAIFIKNCLTVNIRCVACVWTWQRQALGPDTVPCTAASSPTSTMSVQGAPQVCDIDEENPFTILNFIFCLFSNLCLLIYLCLLDGIDLGLSGDGEWGVTWKAVPCLVGNNSILSWYCFFTFYSSFFIVLLVEYFHLYRNSIFISRHQSILPQGSDPKHSIPCICRCHLAGIIPYFHHPIPPTLPHHFFSFLFLFYSIFYIIYMYIFVCFCLFVIFWYFCLLREARGKGSRAQTTTSTLLAQRSLSHSAFLSLSKSLLIQVIIGGRWEGGRAREGRDGRGGEGEGGVEER